MADVPCGHAADLAHAPLPQETGVYRAGLLVLAIGEDLARLPASDLVVPTGSDAIAVVSGQKPVRLTVDRSSVPRFSLQFTAPVSGSPTGAYAVRLPACGARRGGAASVHRFMGGFTVHGTGCVRLTVTPAGGPASMMLIPVGDTLRGCPTRPARGTLPAGAMPYLGVSWARPVRSLPARSPLDYVERDRGARVGRRLAQQLLAWSSCVQGTFTAYRADVHLYRPGVLGGRVVFTRMTVTYPGTVPPYPPYESGRWTVRAHYGAQYRSYFWQ